jgi:thymidylate synthase (FAD)
MNVRLISITKPVVDELNTSEDLVAYCARVSNPSNQMNMETAPRLIKYLIKHKHWSPMEMASCCFEIQTSRAIAAQILRHRSFSFQEFSQRYSVATALEPIEIRKQGKTNRQVGDDPVELTNIQAIKLEQAQRQCIEIYNELVESGIAKECARMVLPLNTSTTLYMNGTLRSWVHYLELRTKQDTQKEHRDIAIAIRDILFKQYPIIAEALKEEV